MIKLKTLIEKLASTGMMKSQLERYISSSPKTKEFVYRVPFFYRTSSHVEVQQKLEEKLKAAGIQYEITKAFTRFVPFRGGSTIAQGSHYQVRFKVITE